MNHNVWTSLFAVCAVLFCTSSALAAMEYRCKNDPVDNDAIAVSYTDVDVSAFSDPNQKTCTFTIDGPKRDANGARGSLLSQASVFSSEIHIEMITKRLTLSRSISGNNEEEVRTRIHHVLEETKDELISCFFALIGSTWTHQTDPIVEGEYQIFIDHATNGMIIRCAIFPPGRHHRISIQETTLVLSHHDRRDRSYDVLFVPSGAIEW